MVVPLLEPSGESHFVRKHLFVVPVPVALKAFLRLVLLLHPKKFCKIWTITFNLTARRVAMMGQVVRVPAAGGHVATPANIKQIPRKNSGLRTEVIAARGNSSESEKSIAIPAHQRMTMRLREPWSRAFDESFDRLTRHAMISGAIQSANAAQKSRPKSVRKGMVRDAIAYSLARPCLIGWGATSVVRNVARH
jgi:hypothetical protein